MSELGTVTCRVAHCCLAEKGEVNGDALGDIVAAPVAVTTTLDGDTPVTSSADSRQGLDGLGDFLGVLWLQDAPRLQVLRRATPKRLKGKTVCALRPRRKQQAVSEPSFYQRVALGTFSQQVKRRVVSS